MTLLSIYRKNLSKIQSKSLATLRQKLRKYNREEKMAAEIAKFRENPDLPDSDEEEKRAKGGRGAPPGSPPVAPGLGQGSRRALGRGR